MLYFTSPWLFCNHQFVLLNPLTFHPFRHNQLPSGNHQNALCCCRLWPAESACCGWRWEQMHTDYFSCGEKGQYRYSLKMRVLWLLLSREERLGHSLKGRVPRPCLDRLLLFLSGFIIYYIECCCLHFGYNQGNENNKCRRERWWADYAPSVGKFIQALEITLKIGNKHLLFQTGAREF